MADTLSQIRVGPEHHGQRMSFAEFHRAESADGRLYELSRGIVTMMDVPNLLHALMLDEIDLQVSAYRLTHRHRITLFKGGSDAKIELPGIESDRHPDRGFYLTALPTDNHPWDSWIPAIVIEVVSPGAEARHRDYVEKREEYLAAGVLEYWIVDPQQREVLQLRRHGDQWRERTLGDADQCTTPLLPEFALELAPIFAVLDRPGAK